MWKITYYWMNMASAERFVIHSKKHNVHDGSQLVGSETLACIRPELSET